MSDYQIFQDLLIKKSVDSQQIHMNVSTYVRTYVRTRCMYTYFDHFILNRRELFILPNICSNMFLSPIVATRRIISRFYEEDFFKPEIV